MAISSAHLRMSGPSHPSEQSEPGSRFSGPASLFYKRMIEARQALDAIAPFGVFDRDPMPGFTRRTEIMDSSLLGLTNRAPFPVTVIEDRSDSQRHIAVLARRPECRLLFSRHTLEAFAANTIGYETPDPSSSGIPNLGGHERIAFYSFHLPVTNNFGPVLHKHTGRHWRMGYDLTESTICHAAPYMLVHSAIGLEIDVSDALNL